MPCRSPFWGGGLVAALVVKPGLNRREAGLGPSGWISLRFVVGKPAFRRREAGRGRVARLLVLGWVNRGLWCAGRLTPRPLAMGLGCGDIFCRTFFVGRRRGGSGD